MTSRRRMMMGNSGPAKTKGVIDGVIQDSLEQVVINCQYDKAKKFYSIGDHVAVPLQGIGTFYFDYLGSGLETRADGEKKPVSTWLCRDLVTVRGWHTANTHSPWNISNLREYCRSTLYQAFPDIIRSNLITVIKTTDQAQAEETIWIPSKEELVGGLYQIRFPDSASRRKEIRVSTSVGPEYTVSIWWTRSYYGSPYTYCVTSYGAIDKKEYYRENGVCPGFCI